MSSSLSTNASLPQKKNGSSDSSGGVRKKPKIDPVLDDGSVDEAFVDDEGELLVDDGEEIGGEVPAVSEGKGGKIKVAGDLIGAAGYHLWDCCDSDRILNAGKRIQNAGDEISNAGRNIFFAITVGSKIDYAKVIINAGKKVLLADGGDQNVPEGKEDVRAGREETEAYGKLASNIIMSAAHKIFSAAKDIGVAEIDHDGRQIAVCGNQILASGKELVSGGKLLVEAAEKDFGDPPVEKEEPQIAGFNIVATANTILAAAERIFAAANEDDGETIVASGKDINLAGNQVNNHGKTIVAAAGQNISPYLYGPEIIGPLIAQEETQIADAVSKIIEAANKIISGGIIVSKKFDGIAGLHDVYKKVKDIAGYNISGAGETILSQGKEILTAGNEDGMKFIDAGNQILLAGNQICHAGREIIYVCARARGEVSPELVHDDLPIVFHPDGDGDPELFMEFMDL